MSVQTVGKSYWQLEGETKEWRILDRNFSGTGHFLSWDWIYLRSIVKLNIEPIFDQHSE